MSRCTCLLRAARARVCLASKRAVLTPLLVSCSPTLFGRRNFSPGAGRGRGGGAGVGGGQGEGGAMGGGQGEGGGGAMRGGRGEGGGGASHSDFSTQWKTGDVADVRKQVENDVSENRIFLFMKGTPTMPQCGFSRSVVQILQAMEVDFKARDVLSHPALRDVVKEFSDWPTFPQLWCEGELIGGHDIVVEMFKSGELETTLKPEESKE